ncbi:MAG TPA: four helix bundle protein [Geobacteraceae bacterium]
MGKGGFEELAVWQRSKELAVEVYRLTNAGAFAKDFGLRDRMRRAAVSVPSNIAEGDERETDREANRYFYVAKGSLAELLTQTVIALEIGYLTDPQYQELQEKCRTIMKMLASLIRARQTITARPSAKCLEPRA